MYNYLYDVCWKESNVILTDAFNTHIFGFSVSSSVSFIKVHVQQWTVTRTSKINKFSNQNNNFAHAAHFSVHFFVIFAWQ